MARDMGPSGETILRNGAEGARLAALALIGASVVLGTLILLARFSVEDATLRAAIETVLVLSGLVGAWLMWFCAKATGEVSDFLVLAAVLTLTLAHLAFFAIPAMVDSHARDCEAALPLIIHLEAAGLFAAGALMRRGVIASSRQSAAVLAASLVGAAAVTIGALLIYGGSALFGPNTGPAPRTTTLAIALGAPAIGLMLLAAVGFVRSALRRGNASTGLLGAAAILLGAAWSHSFDLPALTANSVSGRECLLVGAFGLIVIFASHSRRQLLRAQADRLTAAERRRLVCDLHDGMAQDLAFIAAYAGRLGQEFGADHPLTVAARRALAASRGFITDLSASDAPNTAAALRAVAEELSIRHDVSVTVEVHGEDLTGCRREQLVRIAREAIVNAVQHGHAQHITVSLESRDDEVMLRISDDGGGLKTEVSADPHRGFGLRAMHERAEAIGGDLIVDERSGGGTSVKAVVS